MDALKPISTFGKVKIHQETVVPEVKKWVLYELGQEEKSNSVRVRAPGRLSHNHLQVEADFVIEKKGKKKMI